MGADLWDIEIRITLCLTCQNQNCHLQVKLGDFSAIGFISMFTMWLLMFQDLPGDHTTPTKEELLSMSV